ncbi:DUF1080 domain-containing protein [Mucilaginibacter sp. ZT4R22]|uniref:DUF1080 domain-containing protein n=1 Tax=Mucilaginibacter pankratovii TaxID=2772110 RepID=A0ABR7WJ78_9SPHI|nr:DUF1080 domain-containing protein [Mucilaginibacter pankratovii]MBD1362382.1 DUF1080 domain-containing protein [Mucilaginibacter pankratovii]
MKFYITLLIVISQLVALPCFSQELSGKPTHLLTKDLKYWDTFLGVPHTSLALKDYPMGDGMNGTPIGLNKDPLHVFSVEMIGGQPVLHISGQMYGGLSTKQEFENYHLKVEFKWGDNKYEPRLKDKRDNGIIYHATGPHAQFWNVWMRGHEFQVQEGDMGDYYSLSGVGMDINTAIKPNPEKKEWIYDPAGPLVQFTSDRTPASTCLHRGNYEKPNGEWNTLELYCYGDKSIHVVNGHVVMALQNSRLSPKEGTETGFSKGKIQIQSEAAEAYYRNITITRLNSLPSL